MEKKKEQKENFVPPKTRKMLNDWLIVYKSCMGNVSSTCEKLGISRRTFYNYKKKYPWFEEELDFIDDKNIDFAESMLLKNIREGKETSIIFFLKTKGKDRGYVEKTEHDVSVNSFLELMQNLPDESSC